MTRPASIPGHARAGHGLSVAIVMPVRNEASRVAAAVRRLGRDFPDAEVVVVDGGSKDGTAELAATHCHVIHSTPGRARQMNAGAAATCSDVVWFVHADTEIDPAALGQLRSALSDGRVVGGGLTLRFDSRSLGLDYLAWSSTKRARHLHQIFGDQAMFVRRRTFDAVGGFPDLPILEDLELSRRLARLGRLAVLDATATASARRFTEHGTWPLIFYMQYLKVLYVAGADPQAIAERYRNGPPWRRLRATGAALRSLPAADGEALDARARPAGVSRFATGDRPG